MIYEFLKREYQISDKVITLAENGDNASRPWFGQLMKGPQVMAFLIQVNEWLKEYNVEIV